MKQFSRRSAIWGTCLLLLVGATHASAAGPSKKHSKDLDGLNSNSMVNVIMSNKLCAPRAIPDNPFDAIQEKGR